MRSIFFFISFFSANFTLSAQTTNDSVWKKIRADIDSIKEIYKDSAGFNKSTGYVEAGSSLNAPRDNSIWENRWQNHIEVEGMKITVKAINKHSPISVYHIIAEFSINENGSLRDLKLSCSPKDDFVEAECRKMVLAAPKKPPVYKNNKFVRTHIRQPIDIKLK